MTKCTCLTHQGPHFLHMDAIAKEHNHAILEQVGRYVEAGMVDLAYNLLHYHAQAELERLREKEAGLMKTNKSEGA